MHLSMRPFLSVSPAKERESAFSFVELLVAVSILAFLAAPVLCMTRFSFEAIRGERLRVQAEEICLATMERFGRGQDNLQACLTPISGSSGPERLGAEDLWTKVPALYTDMGFSDIQSIAAHNGLKMKVTLSRNIDPGLDQLVCAVSWSRDQDVRKGKDQVTDTRFLIHEHLH